MITFLDLLIIVVMALSAAGLLTLALMFLVKNEKVRRVCLWIAAALGVYVGYVGLRIMWPEFLLESTVAVLVILAGIGSVVLERLSKGSEKRFLAARIMAASSLVVGMLNAFFI